MRKRDAWKRWPDHDGHDIGSSLGDVVCATCGYMTLERGTQPDTVPDRVAYPYWETNQ